MAASEGTYEVEDIVDERIGKDGREEFRVRWRTYTEEDDTWEPLENLDGFCTPMIEAMRLKRKQKSETANPHFVCDVKEEISESVQEKETRSIFDEESQGGSKSYSSSQVKTEPSPEGHGGRFRRRGGGPRLLKDIEKRPNNSRKSHWEHRTLEVLTPEAWNKYGDLEKREISNLYIPDRIPTETEKLLCEFHPEVGRVTRNQLKAMRATQVKVETQETKKENRNKKTISKKGKNKDDSVTDALSTGNSEESGFFTSTFTTPKTEADANSSTLPSVIQEDSSVVKLPLSSVKIEASDEAVLSAFDRIREASMAHESTSSTSLDGSRKRNRGRPKGTMRHSNVPNDSHTNENNATESGTESPSVSSTTLRSKPATRGRGRGRRGGNATRKRTITDDEDVTINNTEQLDGLSHRNVLNDGKGESKVRNHGTPRKRGRKKASLTQEGSDNDGGKDQIHSAEFDESDRSSIEELPGLGMFPEKKACVSAEADDIKETKSTSSESAGGFEVEEAENQTTLNRHLMRRRGMARRGKFMSQNPQNIVISSTEFTGEKICKSSRRMRKKCSSKNNKKQGHLIRKRKSAISRSSPREDSLLDVSKSSSADTEVGNRSTASIMNSVDELMEANSDRADVSSNNGISLSSMASPNALNEQHWGHPLMAEYSDFPMPKAPKDITLDELMKRFAFLEREEVLPPAQTISELRAAVLQGNISLAKGSLRHSMWRNSALHLDEKRFGKNLVMEICEKNCDESHMLDDMLRFLVYAGARLDTVDDVRGRTPLHIAAANELWCRIRVLLSLRSPVNMKDNDGKTPLQIVMSSRASSFHVVRAIYLLLEYGADVNEVIERQQKNRFIPRLIEYREKLTKHFEEARQKVLIDMTVKRAITPVIVRSVWECYGKNRIIQYDFKHESSYLPNVRYMYVIVLALFDYRGPRMWKIRMWGNSPFGKVLLNRKGARILQSEENGFVYAAQLYNGFNQLQLQVKEEATWKKQLVLTQVLLVQVHKPTLIIPPPPLEVAPESGTDWRKD